MAATFSRFWPHRKVACSTGALTWTFLELQVRLVSVSSFVVCWNTEGTALSSPGVDLSAFAGLFAALGRILDFQKWSEARIKKHFFHHITEFPLSLGLCSSLSVMRSLPFSLPTKWLMGLSPYCHGCCFSFKLIQPVFIAYIATLLP